VGAAHAARIYLFNVRLWRRQGGSGASDATLTRLEHGLSDLVGRPDGETVTWIVRQTVVPSADSGVD
jgi:hypothetical protein